MERTTQKATYHFNIPSQSGILAKIYCGANILALSEDEILKVAHLARLAISPEELPIHAKNLSNILDLMTQMSDAKTSGIEPMSHPFNASQPLRVDEVTEPDLRKKMQSIAPNVAAGLYLVPQVIE